MRSREYILSMLKYHSVQLDIFNKKLAVLDKEKEKYISPVKYNPDIRKVIQEKSYAIDGFIPINVSNPQIDKTIIPPIVGEYYSYNKDGEIKKGNTILKRKGNKFTVNVNGVSYHICMPPKSIIASRFECRGKGDDDLQFYSASNLAHYFNVPVNKVKDILSRHSVEPIKGYTIYYGWPDPYLTNADIKISWVLSGTLYC